jgi:hypothetical protein
VNPRVPALLLLGTLGVSVFLSSQVGARPILDESPQPVAGLAAPAAQPADAASSTWYCAAGTAQSDGFADHTVVVANATDHDVHGVLTVFAGRLEKPAAPSAPPSDPAAAPSATAPPDPTTTSPPATDPAEKEEVEKTFTVGAHARGSFRLADIRAAELAAAVVEVDSGGVAVEHQVNGASGTSDVAACASTASPDWHFGWGATTRDAREVLVLFNPFPSDVTVDGVFSTAGGVREPLRWQGLAVPGRSVVGIDLGDDVTRREQVSATIHSRGGLLVVDRLQMFDGSLGKTGVNLDLGQPAAQLNWGFPEGRVGGPDSEQIVVYNPGDKAAEVDVSVVLGPQPEGTAPPAPFGVVVRPQSFELVDFGAEARVPKSVGHSTIVRSRNGIPVVAERVSLSAGRVSGSPGALFAATSWILPATTDSAAATQRLVLLNAHPSRTAHVVSPLNPGQVTEVPPGTRAEVALPAGSAGDALVVRSDVALVAERVTDRSDASAAANPGLPIRTAAKPVG